MPLWKLVIHVSKIKIIITIITVGMFFFIWVIQLGSNLMKLIKITFRCNELLKKLNLFFGMIQLRMLDL